MIPLFYSFVFVASTVILYFSTKLAYYYIFDGADNRTPYVIGFGLLLLGIFSYSIYQIQAPEYSTYAPFIINFAFVSGLYTHLKHRLMAYQCVKISIITRNFANVILTIIFFIYFGWVLLISQNTEMLNPNNPTYTAIFYYCSTDYVINIGIISILLRIVIATAITVFDIIENRTNFRANIILFVIVILYALWYWAPFMKELLPFAYFSIYAQLTMFVYLFWKESKSIIRQATLSLLLLKPIKELISKMADPKGCQNEKIFFNHIVSLLKKNEILKQSVLSSCYSKRKKIVVNQIRSALEQPDG